MIKKEFFGETLSIQQGQIVAKCLNLSIGALCWLYPKDHQPFRGTVVALQGMEAVISPLDPLTELRVGDRVVSDGGVPSIMVSEDLLGKVVDPWGMDLNHKDAECSWRNVEDISRLEGENLKHGGVINDKVMGTAQQPDFNRHLSQPIRSRGPSPLERQLIREPLSTGIKAIDVFCTLARGQRVGVFAPAGVGKTTLLQMMIEGAQADIVVVGLIGERGREVQEFISHFNRTKKQSKSVVVVSLSDDPPALRGLAAQSATAIAEYFRDRGLHVLLLIDSLTRVARALREIAIASGEMPLRGGFPASVYAELPLLLERAGATQKGSITAIYTVLLPNEDEPDYLAEEIKSLVDAHILLSDEVNREGIRPAIDILKSCSRIYDKVNATDFQGLVSEALRSLSIIRKNQLVLMLGVVPDKELQAAQKMQQKITKFLCQSMDGFVSLEESKEQFRKLMYTA